MIQATRKLFNRSKLDQPDPTEAIGLHLPGFGWHNVFSAREATKAAGLCTEAYEELLRDLPRAELPSTQTSITDYQDAQHSHEEQPRRYVALTRETPRGSRVTILTRFLPHGRYFYVGLDAYVLGATNWWAVLWRLVVTLSVPTVTMLPMLASLLLLPRYRPSSSDMLLLMAAFLMSSLWVCGAGWLLWLKVIRNYRAEGRLGLALRQAFNLPTNNRSFNTDDVLMALQSALPVVSGSIREVFERNGIPVASLERYVMQIQNVQNIFNNYGDNNGMLGAFMGPAQMVKMLDSVGERMAS